MLEFSMLFSDYGSVHFESDLMVQWGLAQQDMISQQ